jgi:hypothetical protein
VAELIPLATVQSLIADPLVYDQFDEESQFLFYNEDTVLDHIDLDNDHTAIIVMGDLLVSGNIYNENTDGACGLIVLGNLQAKNIAVGGQLIYVKGNIRVEEVLIGSYNHGELYSYGGVFCPLIISDDYHFHFTTDVKVLDPGDEDDNFSLMELLTEDLFDEDEFNFYAVHAALKEGTSILKPVSAFTEITIADYEQILRSPLFGPDTLKLAFSDGDWHITLIRPHEDTTPLLIAINPDAGLHYYWSVDETAKVNTYFKENEEWVNDNSKFGNFTILQSIVSRRERWNEKNKETIDKDLLWKLIWMFSPYEDQDKYQPLAVTVFTRVLYAATFPFAYLHDAYKTTPSVKMALIDGLISQEIIQEIEVDKPMGAQTAKLDTVTNLCWDVVYEIHEHYKDHPINRPFISDINEGLTVYSGAILRLDIGTENYIIAGMHTNNIPAFIELSQQFDIYPKYYMPANEVEENALKIAAVAIEDDIRYNKCRGLLPYRKFTVQLWNYRYHEHGDVEYWSSYFDNLRSALITKSTMVGTKVSAEDFNYWWEWQKQCQTILDGLEKSKHAVS